MTERQHREYFDKLTDEIVRAENACGRSYAVWQDACDRLKRLHRQREQEWDRILDIVIKGEAVL